MMWGCFNYCFIKLILSAAMVKFLIWQINNSAISQKAKPRDVGHICHGENTRKWSKLLLKTSQTGDYSRHCLVMSICFSSMFYLIILYRVPFKPVGFLQSTPSCSKSIIKQRKDSSSLKATFSKNRKNLNKSLMLIKRPFVHDSNFSSWLLTQSIQASAISR